MKGESHEGINVSFTFLVVVGNDLLLKSQYPNK
jgi:hypothetical protein